MASFPFDSQGGGIFIKDSSTQVDFQNCNIYSNEAKYVSTCLLNGKASLNVPIAPMWCLLFMHHAYCSQGGGVSIEGGNVQFIQTNIFSNIAYDVRACLLKHPIAPMWCLPLLTFPVRLLCALAVCKPLAL